MSQSSEQTRQQAASPSSDATRMQNATVQVSDLDVFADARAGCMPPADTLAHCSAVIRHGHMRVGLKGIQQLLE